MYKVKIKDIKKTIPKSFKFLLFFSFFVGPIEISNELNVFACCVVCSLLFTFSIFSDSPCDLIDETKYNNPEII